MIRFSQIMLLHGQDELPSGSVERLEALLRTSHPMVKYSRPLIPMEYDTKAALDFVERYYVYRMDANSLLVGVGRGGLIASAIQFKLPALSLSVAAINSPTDEDGVTAGLSGRRLALYSSAYKPIAGRCDWHGSSPLAYDLPWLANGCENFYPLAYLISSWAQGAAMDKEISMMFPPEV
jgi:hypothetical protein